MKQLPNKIETCGECPYFKFYDEVGRRAMCDLIFRMTYGRVDVFPLSIPSWECPLADFVYVDGVK